MSDQNQRIFDFIVKIEPLKTLLRHSWLSTGRRESVAEHTWRMAVMAIFMHDKLDKKVSLERVLKIILVHDLPEIYAGDSWAFNKKNKRLIKLKERKSLVKLAKGLPKKLKKEILELSDEYMKAESLEAKFAKALDKLEVVIQHNQSSIKTQNKKEIPFNFVHGAEQVKHDGFLTEFRNLVKEHTLRYYKKNRVDKKLYKDYLD